MLRSSTSPPKYSPSPPRENKLNQKLFPSLLSSRQEVFKDTANKTKMQFIFAGLPGPSGPCPEVSRQTQEQSPEAPAHLLPISYLLYKYCYFTCSQRGELPKPIPRALPGPVLLEDEGDEGSRTWKDQPFPTSNIL